MSKTAASNGDRLYIRMFWFESLRQLHGYNICRMVVVNVIRPNDVDSHH